MEFLQGLNDCFSSLRSQVLLMDPLPSVQRIFNLVKQEEAQQIINSTFNTSGSVESAALQVNRSESRNFRSTNKRVRPFCDHCNKHGHTRQTCYQLHGYPAKCPDTSSSQPQVAVVTSTSGPSLTQDQYARLLALITSPSDTGNDTPKSQLSW